MAARDRENKATLKNVNINERTLKLLSFANGNDYEFKNKAKNYDTWNFYHLSIRKQIESIENIISLNESSYQFEIADVITKTGAEITADTDKITVLKISGLKACPKFYLAKASWLEKIQDSLGYNDIDFKDFKDFSNKYALRGDNNEAEIRAFFTTKLLTTLVTFNDIVLSSNGKDLLIHLDDDLLSDSQIETLIDTAKRLVKAL